MTLLRLYVDEDSMDADFIAALRLRVDVRTANEDALIKQIVFLSEWI